MSTIDWVPLLISTLSIPLSLCMWLSNVAVSKFRDSNNEELVIQPKRWLFSIVAPMTLMVVALRRKSVNTSGALLGVIFAFILSIANHAFFASLAIFFFSSSKATKFGAHLKRKFEKGLKEGEGQRNWVQVLCNGGMATQLALLYLIECGSSEKPIDFVKDYRSSWLSVAVLSAFSCCNGDTWASELGSVISLREPLLITSLKTVPRGTNGGVSVEGLLVSTIGGSVVGLGYYTTVFYTTETKILFGSPPQWPLIIIGAIAGLLGSLLDSLIGATLQYSGIDENGKIVEMPGKGVHHISGLPILNNHSVNIISSILTSVAVPFLALKCWPDL